MVDLYRGSFSIPSIRDISLQTAGSAVKKKRVVRCSLLPRSRVFRLLLLPVATWTLYRASLILTIVGTSTDRDDRCVVFGFLA